MSDSPQVASIELRPNGPYLVNGITDCRNSKGEPIRTEPTMLPVSLRRVEEQAVLRWYTQEDRFFRGALARSISKQDR